MRTLIIGVTGNISIATTRELIARGDRVAGLQSRAEPQHGGDPRRRRAPDRRPRRSRGVRASDARRRAVRLRDRQDRLPPRGCRERDPRLPGPSRAVHLLIHDRRLRQACRPLPLQRGRSLRWDRRLRAEQGPLRAAPAGRPRAQRPPLTIIRPAATYGEGRGMVHSLTAPPAPTSTSATPSPSSRACAARSPGSMPTVGSRIATTIPTTTGSSPPGDRSGRTWGVRWRARSMSGDGRARGGRGMGERRGALTTAA